MNHLYLYSVNCSQQPLHPSTLSVRKRLIDIFGAIVGLIITLMVAIVVAIVTFIHDPNPIFYSQIRCGLNGKTFRIWKFRSMIVDADKFKHLVENQAKGHIFKSVDDPRITPLGKFLRRTSLDEFPQFWNVLIGDMSLVGTRPPTPDEVSHYDPHHWDRLRVKPGITGEWQANGRSSITDFETIVKMDVDYQCKWSVTYDLSLIIKTIGVVLKKTGAY
ncbi:MAG: sugar transferase [Tolypothrix sp. T3-bin4]|nr:sugar transferase [Tolypothrix sp. T3-bin4]